jgi:hypothetical protein
MTTLACTRSLSRLAAAVDQGTAMLATHSLGRIAPGRAADSIFPREFYPADSPSDCQLEGRPI